MASFGNFTPAVWRFIANKSYLKFPVFEIGDDPQIWIRIAEQFIVHYDVPDQSKVSLVSYYIDKVVLEWMNVDSLSEAEWEDFATTLYDEFRQKKYGFNELRFEEQLKIYNENLGKMEMELNVCDRSMLEEEEKENDSNNLKMENHDKEEEEEYEHAKAKVHSSAITDKLEMKVVQVSSMENSPMKESKSDTLYQLTTVQAEQDRMKGIVDLRNLDAWFDEEHQGNDGNSWEKVELPQGKSGSILQLPTTSTVSPPFSFQYHAQSQPPILPEPPPQDPLPPEHSTVIGHKEIGDNFVEFTNVPYAHKMFDVIPELTDLLYNKLIRKFSSYNHHHRCFPLVSPPFRPPLQPLDLPQVYAHPPRKFNQQIIESHVNFNAHILFDRISDLMVVHFSKVFPEVSPHNPYCHSFLMCLPPPCPPFQPPDAFPVHENPLIPSPHWHDFCETLLLGILTSIAVPNGAFNALVRNCLILDTQKLHNKMVLRKVTDDCVLTHKMECGCEKEKKNEKAVKYFWEAKYRWLTFDAMENRNSVNWNALVADFGHNETMYHGRSSLYVKKCGDFLVLDEFIAAAVLAGYKEAILVNLRLNEAVYYMVVVVMIVLVGVILEEATLGYWIVQKVVMSEDGHVDVSIGQKVNGNTTIGLVLIGMDLAKQTSIHGFLVQQLDGAINEWGWCKQKLGKTLILVVS